MTLRKPRDTKRDGTATERAWLKLRANGKTEPPPARHSNPPTPDDSRRWVLAGLRAYERSGRTRLPTAHCFPGPTPSGVGDPVPPWGSFSSTAAGQPRLLNRVPIFSLCECAGTNTSTAILGSAHSVNTISWGPPAISPKSAKAFKESFVHWSPGQCTTSVQWSKALFGRPAQRRRPALRRPSAGGRLFGHRALVDSRRPTELWRNFDVPARFAEEVHDRRL